MLRSAALASAVALATAAGASAEVVARGVEDGLLALGAKGPAVAFVRGPALVIASHSPSGRWTQEKAATIGSGASVMAFEISQAGPVVLVETGDSRSLSLVRRKSVGWQTIRLVGRLPANVRLGWPGLALDRRGRPVVAYSRWNGASLSSRLLLARVDAKGRVKARAITSEGFPKSLVPPPAAPVLFGGRVHVIESYGYRGVLGTLEWFPQGRSWTGFGLDSGVGDFPVGPVFAGTSPSGVLHAAWTESLSSFDNSAPVTLAARRTIASSKFILNRALTTGLVLPSSGAEVAANEWMASADLGLSGSNYLWAGMMVYGKAQVELDGWLAGLKLSPRGGRDVLLGGPDGLRWFRSARRLATRVTLEARDQSGSVALHGTVSGVSTGRVTLYRERPGERRRAIGRAGLSGGSFSFSDRPTARPLLYRAVYVDPASGIPYAALLRTPIS